MAHIVISLATGINPVQSGDGLTCSGSARCVGMDLNDDDIPWSAEISPSDTAGEINDAIRDAAVAAAGIAGYTVGALDRKIIMGGAIGLV